VSLEEEQRATRDEVKALAAAVAGLAAAIAKLGDEVTPKLLNRRAIGAMLGITQENLRTHLSRKNADGELSPLGKTLLRLAIVGPNGRQAWRPSDIAAHCRPWLGRGEADE
jgi:hypothetical protein